MKSKPHLRKTPSFFFMSSKLQKPKGESSSGARSHFCRNSANTQKSKYVPSILAVEGSLGRKLSDYIHHIYLAAPLWQTLVWEVSQAHGFSNSKRECSSHSHHFVLALRSPASLASCLFLKYTEHLAVSRLCLLLFPQLGLLFSNSAHSWPFSSCKL